MQQPRSRAPRAPARRLALLAAFAIGVVLALAPHQKTVLAAGPAPAVIAQAAPTPGASTPDNSAKGAGTLPAPAGAATSPASPRTGAAAPDKPAPDAEAGEADAEENAASRDDVTIGNHGIVIRKGSKRVRVEGLGRDREYDSFEQFVQDAPWLAGLVFLTVLLVFLVPLLIIVLLIWYKVRKNRMANETMLKLAERGVVPPAAAMDAIATGNAASLAAAAAPSATASAPAYEHARFLRRRVVWSDLRKGVILTGIGLGLSFFSMLDDGTPNSIGLVFLFVGLGYCLLWFFEERTTTPPRDTPGSPGTPPSGGA